VTSSRRSLIERQIRAFLESNNLSFSTSEQGITLRFASALVSVDVTPWGNHHLIQLRSIVLRELWDRLDPTFLIELNRLNEESIFGRWVYYATRGLLALEHELLGDFLQEEELMTSLAAVARAADHNDDILKARFGGVRSTD